MAKTIAGSDISNLENAGEILSLIATGAAASRTSLLEASGLSRVTVTQRLNALLGAGLVREKEERLPSGGRPSRVLAVSENVGIILVANIGEIYVHIAAMDLQPSMVAQLTIPLADPKDPTKSLMAIADGFSQLLSQPAISSRFLVGIGLSLPTPVDFKRGCVVGPSVLPGWDEFDIRSWLHSRFDTWILVENDVNLMTIYEHRQNFPAVDDMFFIKAGTGIGSGIITNGKLFRGAQGAAGDIGHIQFLSEDAPLCRCGKLGCVEARAGGWAVARDLSKLGFSAQNARDVVAMVENGVPEAIMMTRRAGRTIGEVASDAVSILNPSLIVVGGTMSATGEHVLSGIRELVYQRCLPLATRELQIVLADANQDSALFGAAHLVLDDVFNSRKVDVLLRQFVRRTDSTRVA